MGYAVVCDAKSTKELFLKELYTEENFSRHYRGAGSELLKCAVRESQKRGLDGTLGAFFYPSNSFLS